MSTLKILVPTSEAKKQSLTMPSVPDLKGKIVGFASNEIWGCLVPMRKKVDELLRAKYGAAEIYKVVISAAHETPADVLDEMAKKSNAAIVGLAG